MHFPAYNIKSQNKNSLNNIESCKRNLEEGSACLARQIHSGGQAHSLLNLPSPGFHLKVAPQVTLLPLPSLLLSVCLEGVVCPQGPFSLSTYTSPVFFWTSGHRFELIISFVFWLNVISSLCTVLFVLFVINLCTM